MYLHRFYNVFAMTHLIFKKKKKRKEALGEFLPSWSCCYMMQLSVSTDQAVKAVSQEATKLSLAFSKPPLPSQQVILFL